MLTAVMNIERLEVAAADGDIGRIMDILVDDERWAMRYLVVETGYLSERRVLLSPTSFVAIDPEHARFRIALSRQEVISSPHVDTDRPVSRQHDLAHRSSGKDPDTHLRSVKELRGYHIQGMDAEIGHVVDFIVDEETWEVRFFVVDTSNWWIGKKVLVAPSAVQKVSWEDRKVFVEMTRQAVKDSPAWDPKSQPQPRTAHLSA